MFFKLESIIIPTIIKIGAVAAEGTMARSGLKKLDRAKQIATTKAVKPVRPPAPIPAADSTYVVTFEVPAMAPTEVATKSE